MVAFVPLKKEGRNEGAIFRISSAVEQWTVNPLVVSSNLASGEGTCILKVE